MSSSIAPKASTPQELRSVATSILGASLVATFALLFLSPNFQTNDDVFMEMLFSGKMIVDAPNEYYWPSNVVFGLCMKTLYEANGRIDWYSAWIYLLLGGGAAAILHSIHRLRCSKIVLLLSSLHLYLSFVYLFTHPQFTAAAFVACGAGVALLSSLELRPPAAPRMRRVEAFAASLLIILGSLLRLDAFVSVLLVALPLLICVGIWAHQAALRLACTLLVVSIGAGALLLVDQAVYSRHPWSEFIALRNSIVKVTDYGRIDKLTAAELAKSGWTENDRALMKEWWFIDPELYSRKRIDSLVAQAPTTADRLKERIRETRIIPNVGWFPSEQWIYFVSVWALCLPLIGLRFFPVLAVALSAIYAQFMLVDILGRPAPWRVIFPLLTVTSVVPLMLAAVSVPRGRCQSAVLGAVCVLAWIMFGYRSVPQLLRDSAYRREMRSLLSTEIRRVQPSPAKLFVVVGGGLPLELLFPPFRRTDLSEQLRIFWVALPGRAPFGEEMLSRFGISDLLKSLATRDDLYLVAFPEVMPLIAKAFEEHCGGAVTFTTAADSPKLQISQVRFLSHSDSQNPPDCLGTAKHLQEGRS